MFEAETSVAEAAKSMEAEDMWVSPPNFSASNPLHRKLKEMEALLRCPICPEFMRAPVSLLPCHHTFCSLCIRGHVKELLKSARKPHCPSCRTIIPGSGDFNKNLIPNSTLERVVVAFSEMRDNLKEALTTNASANSCDGSDNSDDPNEATASSHDDIALANDNPRQNNKRDRNSINYAEGEDDSTSVGDDRDEDFGEQASARAARGQLDQATANRKRLAKLSYHGVKKKQLKEYCAQHNLPTHGTDSELRSRHEAFVTLYNADCDSIAPRSHAEIVKEVVEQEKARSQQTRNQKSQAKFLEQIKKGAANGQSNLKTGNDEFDQQFKAGFDRLVAQGRATKKRKVAMNDAVAVTTTTPKMERTSNASSTLPKDGVGGRKEAALDSASVALPCLDTPAAPKLFGDGSKAPSTISRRGSIQQSDLAVPGDALAGLVPCTSGKASASPMVSESKPKTAAPLLQSPRSRSPILKEADVNSKHGESVNNVGADAKKKNAAKKPADSKPPKQPSKVGSKITAYTKPTRPKATAPAPPPSRRSGRSGPWACHICTFHNEKNITTTAKCEMCNQLRSSSSVSQSRGENEITIIL